MTSWRCSKGRTPNRRKPPKSFWKTYNVPMPSCARVHSMLEQSEVFSN